MTKEARMTKHEPNRRFRHLDIVIPSSFIIRASTFFGSADSEPKE
jgi:hypothetical protein